MITETHLTNFRGFEDHTIPFRPLTTIVGRNNAGKSTIVEALRLVSLVVSRFQGRLDRIPRLRKFPKDRKGRDRFKNLDINLQSIFHNYGEPPGRIRARFSTGEVVEVRIDHKHDRAARQWSLKSRGCEFQLTSKMAAVRSLRTGCRGRHFHRELALRSPVSAGLDAQFLNLWLRL